MGATQAGVQDEGTSRSAQDMKERDNADAAKQKAEFDAAKPKGFEDLPPDHPMARRMAMYDNIEALQEKGEEATDSSVAAVIAEASGDTDPNAAPPIDAFTDKPGNAVPVKPVTVPAKPTEAAEQVAAQTTGEVVLDGAHLDKYMVKIKVDGVEELVPASKALGQYQKGAAADVRLANATKLQKEATLALEEAKKQAQQAVSTAATPAEKVEARAAVADTAAMQAKFEEAADAMYVGRTADSARLFAEAVAMGSGVAARVDAPAIDENALVSKVTAGVTQKLSQDGALKQLFTDYPDIKAKRAFQIITDEYANAFIANGDNVETAIFKAGEAIGEEYKLGKWAPKPTPEAGRPLKTDGPTTRAEKLSAKAELDVIQSGNARAASGEEAELTVAQQLEEMRKSRPGQSLQ